MTARILKSWQFRREPCNSAVNYYENALQVHKKEKFTPLYRYIKSRIKSLDKKSVVLRSEIESAKEHLNDADHGNYLLAFQSDKELLDEYLKDNNIQLDNSKSIVENANAMFKKYKKSISKIYEIHKL